MSDKIIKMDHESNKATVMRTVTDDNGKVKVQIKEVDLPEIKMTKGIIRKTVVDENGKTQEVEETIEIPMA